MCAAAPPDTRATRRACAGAVELAGPDAILLDGRQRLWSGGGRRRRALAGRAWTWRPHAAGPVPIVPSAVIFDLPHGAAIAPTAADGYAAADGASRDVAATARSGRARARLSPSSAAPRPLAAWESPQ